MEPSPTVSCVRLAFAHIDELKFVEKFKLNEPPLLKVIGIVSIVVPLWKVGMLVVGVTVPLKTMLSEVVPACERLVGTSPPLQFAVLFQSVSELLIQV